MWNMVYRSLMATMILAVLLCGVYPLIVYGIGQVLFHDRANGGIIMMKDGKPVGAHLIGQGFSKPEYFHGRPSSAGDKGYDAANSSGSNLGPTNQKLYDAVKANVDAFLKENPSVKRGEVPTDMVTGSGSGLDPHISPEGAMSQVNRVAKSRGASADEVKAFVQAHIEGPQLGLFGESVVNVLQLNLDLDSKFLLHGGG
jgi:K+-transporting ATPase ATPase C chain